MLLILSLGGRHLNPVLNPTLQYIRVSVAAYRPIGGKVPRRMEGDDPRDFVLPHRLYNEWGEIVMPAEYVELRNGGYYVKGTRVSLDSIVYSFKDGESPETIRQNFPSLTLEQVYGAITFYLGNQAEVDANIREGEEQLGRSVPPLNQSRPDLYARLQKAREELAKPR
jgi:uncharacterized protein (DUF433 family)